MRIMKFKKVLMLMLALPLLAKANEVQDYKAEYLFETDKFSVTGIRELTTNNDKASITFNAKTKINETNQFSIGEPITKAVDIINGSIQKLYAEDTNLLIFQENKVSAALIDKDAIYSAEGSGTPVSTETEVIGQVVPYLGEYGISRNPNLTVEWIEKYPNKPWYWKDIYMNYALSA